MYAKEYEKVCIDAICMVHREQGLTEEELKARVDAELCQVLNAYLFKCISNALCDSDLPMCGESVFKIPLLFNHYLL